MRSTSDQGYQVTTSTAILCRLFVRFEGAGELMASVPIGMDDLADRITSGGRITRKIGREYRSLFGIDHEAIKYVKSLLCIGSGALTRDRTGLAEMLNRIALSGLVTNPLRVEEMVYLQKHVGEGSWCAGLLIQR